MNAFFRALLCKMFGHKTVYDGRLYHRSWHGVRCLEYYHCERCGRFKGEYERDQKFAYVSFFPILALFVLSACGSDNATDGGRKVVSLDLLGIMHEDFPCQKYIKEMEDATEINLGYLAGGTFGNSRECLDKISRDDRTRAIRLHTCSGPCLTNKRCHPRECFYGLGWEDTDDILGRLSAFAEREFSLLAPYKVYYISPVLEHQLDRETFDRAAELLLRLAAEYGLEIEIIDNPLYPRESKYLLEVHGQYETAQRPYIYSLDGYFGIGDFFLAMNDEALVSFRWRPEYNGLCTDGSPWVSPLDRRCW